MQVRQDRRANVPTPTALVGADAQRGVALGVLNIGEALGDGHTQVGHRHVILQIDVLALFLVRGAWRTQIRLHPW